MALEMPSLGRPFSLGMLYDCRNDALIPGITFWNKEMLVKDLLVKQQNNTSFEILASDRFSDKSSALDISASLKVSFLCGLIQVGGSGKFLKDMQTSIKQARVTLKYSRTTRFEQLSMNHLSVENLAYHDVFKKGTATHVVTGILYGAQAFFIFDQDVSPQEDSMDVKVNLQAMIKRIPQGVDVPQVKSKEKDVVKKFECKFHGDFALEQNPVNYEDAIKIYASLPDLLGPEGEKAVPLKVWLYPLNKLNGKAAQLVREIRDNLIFRAEEVMQEMVDVNIQCNDLMKHPAAVAFPVVNHKICQFRDQCLQFTLTFQKQLAQALPPVRGGELQDDAIMAVFTRKEQSPFRNDYMTDFLNKKQQEMDVIHSYLKGLSGIRVASTENKLREILTDQKREYTLCFNFSSLNLYEQYLTDANDWLQASKHHSEIIYQAEKVARWFEAKGFSKRGRTCVKEFQVFADVNAFCKHTQFVVSSVPDVDNPGISIHLYEAGDLVDAAFEPPSKPETPLVNKRSHNSMELSLQPADFGRNSIVGFRVEYICTEEENWACLLIEKNETIITVPGLKINTGYQFRYSAVSKLGLSMFSEVTKPEKTLPTSPPGTPEVAAKSQSLTVFWSAPLLVGEGVIIKQYMVEYKPDGTDTWLSKQTESHADSCVIEGLKMKTLYKIRVKALCGVSGESTPSDETKITTPAEDTVKVTQQMINSCTLLTPGHPSVYQMQLDCYQCGYCQYTLGKENTQKMNKVILLVGASGSGKITLINGMANYILGVEWKDDFRFKLAPEDTSQPYLNPSSQVTVYKINYESEYRIPYSLTVIDTPDFDDTQGAEQLKIITDSIHLFLTCTNDFDHINAICFVVKAQSPQLTHTQKLLFHTICSMFGNDVKESIVILTSFADAQQPPVLEAIKAANIPCAEDSTGDPIYFKFNNSALFVANNQENRSLNKMFWGVGMESFGIFLQTLRTMGATNLKMTQEVLKIRKHLDVSLKDFLSEIKVRLMRKEEMSNTQRALDENRDLMENNREYEFEEDIRVMAIMAAEKLILHCGHCDFICHFPCVCKVTENDMSKCSAIDKKGLCTACPSKCNWHKHYIEKYGTEYVNERERRTDWQMKASYEEASAEVALLEQEVQILKEEISFGTGGDAQIFQECRQNLNHLRELALRLDPLLSTEYIDVMIQGEEHECGPGHQERIKSFQEAKVTAELLEKIKTGDDSVYDLMKEN